MSAKRELIGRGYKIASELEKEGYSAIDGTMILSIALGIFMEGQEKSHRNLKPLMDSMLDAAQIGFDALRAGRGGRRPGSAAG